MSAVSRLLKISSLFKVIPGLLIMMEILCVYPWLVWLGKSLDPRPCMNFISYLILMLYTYLIVTIKDKALSNTRMRSLVFPSIFLLLAGLIIWNVSGGYTLEDVGWYRYINDHFSFITISSLSGLYFIWRAIVLERQGVYQKFAIGLVSIILFLIIWGISGFQDTGVWSTINICALSYFGLGLLALAIANLKYLNRIFKGYSKSMKNFSQRLFSVQFVIIIVFLGIAVILMNIFSVGLSETVFRAISFLWKIFATVLYFIFYLLGYITIPIEIILKWILHLLPKGEPVDLDRFLNFFKKKKDHRGQSQELHPVLILIIKWLLVAAVITIIIYFIWRIYNRYLRSMTEEGVEEEQESLWSLAYLKADFRNLLALLFPWFFRAKKETRGISTTQGINISRIDPDKVISVREMYQALLRQGRIIKLPRKSSETAYEYSGRLGYELRLTGEELNSITEAYVVERYSENRTAPRKLALLNRMWNALKTKLLDYGSSDDIDV